MKTQKRVLRFRFSFPVASEKDSRKKNITPALIVVASVESTFSRPNFPKSATKAANTAESRA